MGLSGGPLLWRRAGYALLLALVACRGQASAPPPPADDPDPAFSAADLAMLAQLAPATLPPPPLDASNAFADDPRAARLGQRLFFDPLFSGRLLDGENDGSPPTLGMKGETGRVACIGCHVPAAGFLDDRTRGKQISLAAGWVLRRTPSLLDVGRAKLLMWDGRRDSLYGQIFGPLENANEMNSSRLFVAEQVAQRYAADYEAIFGPLPPLADPRFPQLDAAHTGCDKLASLQGVAPVCHGKPGDGAEYDGLSSAEQDAVTRVVVNAGKAIGAYERLLSCGPGRFDGWVQATAALSRAEQRGAGIFVGKGRCVACHSGPFLTDQRFHNVGLAPATVAVAFIDAGDHGAGTGLAALIADPLNTLGRYSDGSDDRVPPPPGPAEEGAFRTPTLRCVARRPSLMHTAQFATLDDAVAFFDRGGYPLGYPGSNELQPLGLTALERSDLVAFLHTLEGPGPDADLLVAP